MYASEKNCTFHNAFPTSFCLTYILLLHLFRTQSTGSATTLVMHASKQSTEIFAQIGSQIMHRNENLLDNTRRFRSLFGTTPEICAVPWIALIEQELLDCDRKHMLWGLLLLKQYGTIHDMATFVRTDKKFGKCSRGVLKALSKLNFVFF